MSVNHLGHGLGAGSHPEEATVDAGRLVGVDSARSPQNRVTVQDPGPHHGDPFVSVGR
jgi:hypothetical protein